MSGLPPLVEIIGVEEAPPAPSILQAHIERPIPGSALDRTSVELAGWVLGRISPANRIEVTSDGQFLRTVPFAVPRPDVVAAHPGAPATSGFWTLAGTLGLEREFTLDLRVVLADGTTVPIGSVRGRRHPIRSAYEPKLQPLMVTSLGRTGTTLLMGLLVAHPDVVAHRTYPYEIFPAKYWLHALRVLAEPANHAESSQPELFGEDIWRVGHHPFYTAPITDSPELLQFFGKAYVEQLAGFCQLAIDDFYRALAAAQGRAEPTFFVEKVQPDHVPRLAWDLYPDARELVLVRDPRDMICSIYAFNAKRQSTGFGRDRVESDEDYISYVGARVRQLVDAWKARRSVARLVHYEDLVTSPTESIRAILDYLGLDRRPETVEAMMRNASETPGFDFHRTTASVKESVGRWRRDLPPSLAAASDESLRSVLAELEYD